MAIKISGTTVIDNDESFNIGTFTTATRPASPSAGTLIYNTDQGAYEYYNGSSWSGISGSDPQIQVLETGGTLLHTLDNPNAYSTSASDRFGYSVAISGNYAIVSAYLEDDAGGASSGKAYIFDVTTGNLVHTLNNPNAYNTSNNDEFGQSVAISGNRAIVSAPYEDESGGNLSGKVYIFDVPTGTLLHTLDNPNAYSTAANDYFGRQSVAISGNRAIVSAYNEDDSGGSNSGKAYIFDVTSGTLLHTLDNPNAYGTSTNDYFGFSVAISGNHSIVGAYQEDKQFYSNSGKAYIYDVATGSLLQTIDNPNAYSTPNADYFGYSVAISGNHAIVGAWTEDDAGGTTSGKAYIFDVATGSLLHTLDNPNAYSTSADDQFGFSVAISGNRAIVSAYEEDDAGGDGSGKAYIFDVDTGSLLHTLDNPNAYSTSASDRFGYSVTISGNHAIVGAYQEYDAGGSQSGKAYIFAVDNIVKLKGIEQIQFTNGASLHMNSQALAPAHAGGELIHVLDNPNAYGTSTDDLFGRLAASISGNRAIISAYFEDDAGGASSGKAYIFDVTSGNLLHTLDNPNAYSTSAGDYFGVSVGISGNRAIISAYFENDAGGNSSGKAYIYDVNTGSLLHTLDNPNAYSSSGNDQFGNSVGISGNRAIVGVRSEDDAGGSSSGKAYIYDVNTGSLLHTLDNPNAYSTSANDRFGGSVAISGNHAIVCANLESDAGGSGSGKAYIYDVNTGSLLHTLDNPNAYSTSASDLFGAEAAISGNRAIITAYGEADAGGADSGKAYIFDVTSGSLLHTLDNPNAYGTSTDDSFGRSVDISGNRAIVGASDSVGIEGEDDASGSESGKAYIFDVTTGNLIHILNNPNTYSTGTDDLFGNSVCITDDYAIVGASREDDPGGADSGKAYIFAARDLTYLDKLVTVVS